MLATLLQKDLRRLWRNPWPWLLNLALPLAITALFGFAFGGGGPKSGTGMARIKVAVVDEDGSLLGSVFRSALNQGEAAKFFEPVTATRDEAMTSIRADKISAVLIVPADFTRQYLSGQPGLALEVIKNPAQRFYPAIVEELASVAVTGLNAVSRNLQSEWPQLQAAVTNEVNVDAVLEIAQRLGRRLQAARGYLFPPLITYGKEVIEAEKKPGSSSGMGVFAFILPGMASAFLLFMADQSLRDIHRETRLRTLDRTRTFTNGLGTFVAGKVVLSSATVFLGGIVLFTAGALVFGIRWARPDLLLLIVAGYSAFAAGLLAMLVAVARDERRSETMNTMLLFGVAFLGGSYFPAENLPPFLRENICPLMPNYWFIEAVRTMQQGAEFGPPLAVLLKLALAGIVLAILATYLLNRRMTSGSRA
jgi:ABC-type multidrug transport system permease subunit